MVGVMLTRVIIKNINAIDSCDISFEKNRYHYLNEMIYNDISVNPIAFYGVNGSGKSSFIKAFSQLISMMIGEPDRIRNFIANQLNVNKIFNKAMVINRKPTNDDIIRVYDNIRSSIFVEFKLSNKIFTYFIETSLIKRITQEKLCVDESIIFERKNNEFTYADENHKIDSNMYPVVRKLANDEHIGNKDLDEAFYYLSNMAYVDDAKRTYQFKAAVEKSYMDIIVDKSKQVKEIMSKYKEFPLFEVISRPNVKSGDDYFANIELENGNLELPFGMISTGMENNSALLSFVLSVPENSTIFIDEIEDALHPLAVIDFINVVKERNIQLIFSSHNTYILQKLRPDQIIFANWKNGYSNYKKLSDIYQNIREVNNIEKMYLSSLFDEDIKKDE